MKISIVITALGMGGAETQVVNLCDEFTSLGHQVLLISLTGETVLRPQNKAVHVECLDMKKTIFGFTVGYLRAFRLLRAFSPDVVHSHMVHANIFARLLRLITPMRCLICSAHSTNEGGAFRMLVYRLTSKMADITTNVSNDAVERFIRVHAAKSGNIIAVPNGIDCRRFYFDQAVRRRARVELDLAESTNVLLAVGRFGEAKDYPNLFKAFDALCVKRADCILLIVGSGPAQASYEALARKMGLEQKIKFLGQRWDVPALMNAADVFVLPSAWEGLPLVVGEAMACERVVVSTNAGGIKEWLGELGYIVPTQDSTRLSNALQLALELPMDEKAAQGKRARERILTHYSLATVAARWLQLYKGHQRRYRPNLETQ